MNVLSEKSYGCVSFHNNQEDSKHFLSRSLDIKIELIKKLTFINIDSSKIIEKNVTSVSRPSIWYKCPFVISTLFSRVNMYSEIYAI